MKINELIKNCEAKLKEKFEYLEEISLYNTEKVLNAFQKNKISARHFYPSTGYGYNDESRIKLCDLFADVFKTESAIVSPNIVSGTHAITIALFGLLKSGDDLLSISGSPYDTLTQVISGSGNGSLKDYNINFDKIALKDNDFDYGSILNRLKAKTPKLIFIQRSRGYEWRSALSCEKIKNVISFLRKNGYNDAVFIDNCYGEFTSKTEPCELGADVIAGSLIKNICGGFAPTGGYIAGKKCYIERIENRLTAPSVGNEAGSYAFTYQYFYQGLFIAPHIVKECLKGSLLIGKVLNGLSYETIPNPDETPYDITRAVKFNDEKKLIKFIQAVQKNSPVDSFALPVPDDMPGYADKIIMASGSFVQGSSIELSADAPIKPPYTAYIQGGLNYEHIKIALSNIISEF